MSTKGQGNMAHLKLAGIIVIIVLVVLSGFFGLTMSSIAGQDARLRCVEERQGRIDERLKNIEASLLRIETKLK